MLTVTQRKRLLALVPCPSCGANMPAGRRAPNLIETTGGTCVDCTNDSRTARPPAPMYETDAWSRGIKLD